MAFTSIPFCVSYSFCVWLDSLPLFSLESSLFLEVWPDLFLTIGHSTFYYTYVSNTFHKVYKYLFDIN